jgi:hypothetical protein
MSCGKERNLFEIQKDIESIKGNNPEKTIEVSQSVLKRLDIIAESIFLPDYMLDESEAHFTELHKDITYLFLIKYIDERPCFILDNSIWRSLRIFHAKRMLFVANLFVREHVRSTDRDFKNGVSASDLEIKLEVMERLYKKRVGKIKYQRFDATALIQLAKNSGDVAGFLDMYGRELICPYDLNWLIQIQKNEGFVKYCIDAGLSLIENELKPFLDEVKDWHDMIESPAYGSNGVCITTYDILYREYFIQKCLEIAREWDYSRFEDCPDLNFGMSDMPDNRYPSLPKLQDPDLS